MKDSYPLKGLLEDFFPVVVDTSSFISYSKAARTYEQIDWRKDFVQKSRQTLRAIKRFMPYINEGEIIVPLSVLEELRVGGTPMSVSLDDLRQTYKRARVSGKISHIIGETNLGYDFFLGSRGSTKGIVKSERNRSRLVRLLTEKAIDVTKLNGQIFPEIRKFLEEYDTGASQTDRDVVLLALSYLHSEMPVILSNDTHIFNLTGGLIRAGFINADDLHVFIRNREDYFVHKV